MQNLVVIVSPSCKRMLEDDLRFAKRGLPTEGIEFHTIKDTSLGDIKRQLKLSYPEADECDICLANDRYAKQCQPERLLKELEDDKTFKCKTKIGFILDCGICNSKNAKRPVTPLKTELFLLSSESDEFAYVNSLRNLLKDRIYYNVELTPVNSSFLKHINNLDGIDKHIKYLEKNDCYSVVIFKPDDITPNDEGKRIVCVNSSFKVELEELIKRLDNERVFVLYPTDLGVRSIEALRTAHKFNNAISYTFDTAHTAKHRKRVLLHIARDIVKWMHKVNERQIPSEGSSNVPTSGFKIAVSFTGECRAVVTNIVERLYTLGFSENDVFIDSKFPEKINGANADVKLRDIYSNADLMVVFLSKNYNIKEWTGGMEWRVARQIINSKHDNLVLINIDDVDINSIDGLSSTTDIAAKLSDYGVGGVAEIIYKIYMERIGSELLPV
jgi:hypothetical protein